MGAKQSQQSRQYATTQQHCSSNADLYGRQTVLDTSSFQPPVLPSLDPGSQLAKQYEEALRSGLALQEKVQSKILKPHQLRQEFQRAHQANTQWVSAYLDAVAAQNRAAEREQEISHEVATTQQAAESSLSDGVAPPRYEDVVKSSHTCGSTTSCYVSNASL